MPRQPIPQFRYPGVGPSYPEADGISNLILEQGRIRADAAARSGDMWANTIAGIGQNIGGVIAEREGQKQLRKRDAAWVSFVESGEWQKDPQAAYGVAKRIWGPDADKQMQGLESVQKLTAAMQGKPLDPTEAKKSLGSIVRAIKPMGNEAWERWWPTLSKLAQTALPGAELPPQFDPAQRAEYEAIGESLLGEKAESFTLTPGSTRFGPDGKPIAAVPVTPERPKKQVVTVRGPNGEPITKLVDEAELEAGVQAYREPKAPRDDRIVQVMGPNGTPIWVREADAVGKPAAQAARAVTGAERQSLAYYNRARQATEDIAPIEEKVTGAGLLKQGQLQYAPNVLQSAEQQSYRQAQRSFTEARLRKESGAAIPTAEYENDAKTYFGQPGDTKAVLEQKRKARNKVLEGLGYSAGKAYEEFYGEPLTLPKDKAADPLKLR